MRESRPYLLVLGGGFSNPLHMWEWCCPNCGWRPREHLEDKAKIVLKISAHEQDCQAGWCTIPRQPNTRVGLEERFIPTKEDRARWQEEHKLALDRRRRATRSADRVVDVDFGGAHA